MLRLDFEEGHNSSAKRRARLEKGNSEMEQEIQQRVMAVLKKNSRLSSVPLTPDTTFDQLRLESLDVICIVFDLEDEFKITISDQAARGMRCIADVVEGVTATLKAQSVGSGADEQQAP